MMGRKKGEARRARETMVRKEAPSEVGKVVQARTLRERRMDLPLSTKNHQQYDDILLITLTYSRCSPNSHLQEVVVHHARYAFSPFLSCIACLNRIDHSSKKIMVKRLADSPLSLRATIVFAQSDPEGNDPKPSFEPGSPPSGSRVSDSVVADAVCPCFL